MNKSCRHLKERVMAAPAPECGTELSFTHHSQSQNDGNILLQLLQFKTHLLEVVEELHIRRDTEERFEEQISKLVLEKQESEREKESLQQQIETYKNHHTESLSEAYQQFQAKIRNLEEEKSRYQVSAEQKDKDIHNLKQELKSLQLLKYNLEKKSSELEQKQVLQSRSKDSHLNQLGEVEKRFNALSRQCTMIKQSHQKLEQNANEAMKLNKKLTSTNEKQEATIGSLNKEVEELRNKLVKAKTSFVNHDKTADNPSIKEQTLKQLHQRLNMEYEMNRKFKDENKALQEEKQDVLRSLQLAHQLLLNQTEAASRLELDIQTQRQQYQSLEQDHKAMQRKEKSVEEKIKQLMEEYTVSKNNWDKERAECLDQMKNEQQELVTVKEAYEKLHQEHTELSSKAEEQAKEINELKLKIKDLDRSVFLSNPTPEGGSQGDMYVNETVSKGELSNAVDALDMAKDLHIIAMGGQAEDNGGTMSEILFKPNVAGQPHHNNNNNLDNGENSNMNEDASDLISKFVSAEAALRSAMESSPYMSSSVTTTKEFDFANTNSKCNMENGFQTAESIEECTKHNGVIINNFIEKHKSDEHALENSEDAKENLAAESENVSIEDRAQDNDEDKEIVGTSDDAMDSMFITENVDKEHGRVEDRSLDAEAQSQTTVDKKQPHTSKVTWNNTQVSHSKTASALEVTSCVDEKVVPAPPIQEITRQEVLPSESEASSNSPVQSPAAESPPSSCHDSEEKTETESEESTSAELPETLNKSSLCQPQNDAAQLDGVSVQGTIQMEIEVVSPPDTAGHVKDTIDNSVKECSPVTEDVICPKSQSEIPELKNNLTNSVATACETGKYLTNKSENDCENERANIKCNFKSKQPISQGNTKQMEPQKECLSGLTLSKDSMSWPSESDLKMNSFKSQLSHSPECLKSPTEKEAKMMKEFAAPMKTTYRPSFEWDSAQKRAQIYKQKSDMSAYNSLLPTSKISPPNAKGCTGQASATLPISLRHKQNKVPLTITRATDLLSGSSVCGTTAASSWRFQPTEWKAIGEAHRDTAAPKKSRVSQDDASSLESTSSGTISKSEERKRTLSPDASGSPESDWELSCSQDTEDQQSTLRTQISKIEEFLSTERLQLSKRRKTENSL